MHKTWLITGFSAGLGRALAESVAARGDRLIATTRSRTSLQELNKRYPDTVETVSLDVTQPGDAARAVAVAKSAFGGVDVLVNNAGIGFIGAIEGGDPNEYRPIFDSNVFGLIETIRAALPALRQREGARVVNMSSGTGIAGSAYGAAVSRPYRSYSATITAAAYAPGCKARRSLKDLPLANDAARASARTLPMLARGRTEQAAHARHAEQDWSAMGRFTIEDGRQTL